MLAKLFSERNKINGAASLSQLWLAVRDALDDIRQRATPITAEAMTAKEDLGNVGGESVTTSEGPAAAAD